MKKRIFFIFLEIVLILFLTIFFPLSVFSQSNLVRIAIINFKANDDISQTEADRFTELVRVVFTNKGIWDVVTPAEVDSYFRKNNITVVTDKAISTLEYDEKFGAKFILYGNMYRNKSNKKQITIVAKIYDVKNRKLLLGVLYNIDENRLLDISEKAPLYEFVDKLEDQIFDSIGAKSKKVKSTKEIEENKKILIDAMVGFDFPVLSYLYDPSAVFYVSSNTQTLEKYSVAGNIDLAFTFNLNWNFLYFFTLDFDMFFYSSSTKYVDRTTDKSIDLSTADTGISAGLGFLLNKFYVNINFGLFSIDNLAGYPFAINSDYSKDLLLEAGYLNNGYETFGFLGIIQYDYRRLRFKLKGGYVILDIYNGHSAEQYDSGLLQQDQVLKGIEYLADLNIIYTFTDVFGIALSAHGAYWNFKIPESIFVDNGITTYPDGLTIDGLKVTFGLFFYIKTGF